MTSIYSMLSANRACSNVSSIGNDGNFSSPATDFRYVELPKGAEETWKKEKLALLKYL